MRLLTAFLATASALVCSDIKYVHERLDCCSSNATVCGELKTSYRTDPAQTTTCCQNPGAESLTRRFDFELSFADLVFNTGFRQNDEDPGANEISEDVQFHSMTDDSVTLQVFVEKWGNEYRAGTYLLEAANASMIVGELVSQRDDLVTRRVVPGSLRGTFRPGDPVEVSSRVLFVDGVARRVPAPVNDAWTPAMFGVAYEEVTYASDVGDLRAYLTTGGDAGVIVWVHGFGGTYTRERLAMTVAMHTPEYKMLIVNVRNDPGEPTDGRGIATYGVTEWRDIDAAITYAHDRFGLPIFLYGISGGAGPVAVWSAEGDPTRVRGIVYDGPTINFAGSIQRNGAARYPFLNADFFAPILAFTEAVYDINLDDYDHRDTVVRSRIPTLMYHYDYDAWNDPADYEYVARRRSEAITHVYFENTGHCTGYNADHVQFLSALHTFLDRLALP